MMSRTSQVCLAALTFETLFSEAATFKGLRKTLPSIVPQPSPSDIARPSCECECCTITRREPHEIHQASVYLKCGHNHDDNGYADGNTDTIIANEDDDMQEIGTAGVSCPMQCSNHERDSVLDSTESLTTNYNRFCFYHCQPFDFTVGGMCVPMSEREEDLQEAGSGNARDAQMNPSVASSGNPFTLDSSGVVEEGADGPATVATTTTLPCEKSIPCMDSDVLEDAEAAEARHEQASDAASAARSVSYGYTGNA